MNLRSIFPTVKRFFAGQHCPGRPENHFSGRPFSESILERLALGETFQNLFGF
jgi:hypothetical protein